MSESAAAPTAQGDDPGHGNPGTRPAHTVDVSPDRATLLLQSLRARLEVLR